MKGWRVKPLPSRDELLEALTYCPESGVLRWRWRDDHLDSWNARFAGSIAFRTKTGGYRAGKFNGVTYFAHRIIWKMLHGDDPEVIDHINGDPSDNRASNLRSGSQSENCRNPVMSRRARVARQNRTTPLFMSRSKSRGIVRSRRGWISNIGVDGKRHYLKMSPCFGVALKARIAAEEKYAARN